MRPSVEAGPVDENGAFLAPHCNTARIFNRILPGLAVALRM